ncbi:DUF805 domain-containing protein [Escherichia coli]|uniref:DUF805 domain-containing protein n=1 Tax=Escherichia coli TaxID=562 RepID=UPI001FCEC1C6|nr:DUF805 domain-containing protein [Escherichia coli]
MMSLWDALRMNMMISYQELVRTFLINVIQLILGLELPYLSMLYLLATFLPVLALAIRRLHDTDRSGAWALLFFVPFIGWLVLLVFFCTEGTSGSNRYGNDPKFGSN